MTKLLLIAIAALFLAVFVLFILWRAAANSKKELREKLRNEEKTNAALVANLEWANRQLEIIHQNRKEADEKIYTLHSGDTVGNAIDVLRKRET